MSRNFSLCCSKQEFKEIMANLTFDPNNSKSITFRCMKFEVIEQIITAVNIVPTRFDRWNSKVDLDLRPLETKSIGIPLIMNMDKTVVCIMPTTFHWPFTRVQKSKGFHLSSLTSYTWRSREGDGRSKSRSLYRAHNVFTNGCQSWLCDRNQSESSPHHEHLLCGCVWNWLRKVCIKRDRRTHAPAHGPNSIRTTTLLYPLLCFFEGIKR